MLLTLNVWSTLIIFSFIRKKHGKNMRKISKHFLPLTTLPPPPPPPHPTFLNKLEMCPLEHVWPAIQHSFKWGATTIKQQYKMGNQFKALNEKKKSNLGRLILIA